MSSDPTPPDDDDGLSARAERLAAKVEGLTMQVGQLNRRAEEADRRGVRAIYALVVLGVILLVLGTVVWQQQRTAGRLEQVVQQSICPLYGLILGSYDPATREEGDKRRRYEDGFVVMRGAAAALTCTAPLVPPREEK